MTRKAKPSGWQNFASFPRPFSYEVDAPLDEVVQRIAALEQEHRPFRRMTTQDISILPIAEGYRFRVQRRRYGGITATAEGQVWTDETTGRVIVEGETRLNGWGMITPLLAIFVGGSAFLMTLVRFRAFIIPLIVFSIGMMIGMVTSWFTYQRDTRQLSRQIEAAVLDDDTDERLLKPKRRSSLALEESEVSSVWNGAIVEPEEKHQRRG